MITDQSQWNGPLVASDGTRTVEVAEVEGPDYDGDYLVTFAESFVDLEGYPTEQAWFKPNGMAFLPHWRTITISPAAEGAGDICQLMPDGGGDASDEITALREEVARLREREARLTGAVSAMVADHMTSETHHPHYVLVPTEAFGQARAALESTDQ